MNKRSNKNLLLFEQKHKDWIEALGNGVQRRGESLREPEGMEDYKSECDNVN